MLKLEDIKVGMMVTGIVPGQTARVVSVESSGADAVTVIVKSAIGVSEQQLYRLDEARLEIAAKNLPWSFEAPADDFKLALEALRIELGSAFDPMMAIHSSNVIPLPHQISAVYEKMLPQQPLRYVLADDPGAGKTIMAGLLIKELLMRADARRVLIVSPGSLTEQWQGELAEKFTIDFKIFSKEAQEQSVSGNFFADEDLVVARVDMLSRNEDYRAKLEQVEWDLVIVDEAHKMSAHWFGKKLQTSLRYELGQLLGRHTRHFLLMTATPHNGKDEDFQLWLQLLDDDRFYSVSHAKGGKIVVDDTIMRRMVKEQLLKFDGTPLFPKRIAHSAAYHLSQAEAVLYKNVTDYVIDGMDKAEKKLNPKMKNCVGFALTLLQRRLASSPEAIFKSLQRRCERLEQKLKDLRAGKVKPVDLPDLEDFDEDDYTEEELEKLGTQILDSQTAALSPKELEEEIVLLKGLVASAEEILLSGSDCKWDRLSELLQDTPEMKNERGYRRKLIIFTEHRDTLNYLERKIKGLLCDDGAVKVIHGGTNRETRREVQEEFNNNPAVTVLIATDAAGEGVNLHKNCNLMINYDLPWNPNRLEQRFGRIHRIGQQQPCILWNMISADTREGQVFQRLLDKLEHESQTLGGQVFDILGSALDATSLKDLLLAAIKYENSEEAKNWMTKKIDSELDPTKLKKLIAEQSNFNETLTADMVYRIKEDMDRAEARKLQPCFVRAFFLGGLATLGGEMRKRGNGRWSIPHVPAVIREKAKTLNSRRPVASTYDYVCFDKQAIRPTASSPEAAFLHPGHPLVAAVTKLIAETKGGYLKSGAVMVDPADEGTEPSLLFMIDHTIAAGAARRTVSRRLQFVRLGAKGEASYAGWAPHLDLKAPDAQAMEIAKKVKSEPWLQSDLEKLATDYATEHVVREHYDDVRSRQIAKLDKLLASVQASLTKAITVYQRKYAEFLSDSKKPDAPATAIASAEQMRRKVDELKTRLASRQNEIADEKNLVSLAPVVQGGILVIPQGLIDASDPGRAGASAASQLAVDAAARKRVELLAMNAVTETEQALGNTVTDVSALKCGWDLTSRYPAPVNKDDPIREDRHIEVKGRVKGATDVILTCNEISYAVNQGDKFILALVLVDGEKTEGPYYIRNIWTNELNFGVEHESYKIADLLTKAEKPEDTL